MISVVEELEKKTKALDESTNRNRSNSIGAIYKMMLLSGSIVAFSVTLVSADALSAKVDLKILHLAWWLFLIAIILGTAILFLESRIEQAKAWRLYMQYAPPKREELSDLSNEEKYIIAIGLFKSLFLPENSIFDKIHEDEKETKKDQIRSFMLLHNIAILRRYLVYGFENLFYIIFIIALVMFVNSIKF